MNETLETALSTLMNTMLLGKDFILDQAPEVIHHLLLWNLTTSLIWFVIGVILIYPSIIIIEWAISEIDNSEGMSIIVGIVAGAVPYIILISSTDWLKISIAPKLYLLEYASNLLK